MKRFLKNKKIGLLILFSIFYLLCSVPVHAQTNDLVMNLINGTPVLPQADLIGIIFKVIQYVLAFVGVVAVIILIYGGFLWMTARGNDEQVNKAKKVLVNGLIGLIVILLSYAIVQFAISKIDQISQPPEPACTPNQCVSGCWRCNGQGEGTNYDATCPPCESGPGGSFVIRWTWPRDGQDNIALCSLIQAGFNDQLDPDSVNEQTVKITLRDALKVNGESCLGNTECKSGKCLNNACQGNVVACSPPTVVGDVFKFDATSDFEKNTWYKVLITTDVRSSQGRALETQRNIEFKTGDQSDPIPPTVENVYPENNQENTCLLEPIQSIFSEAMDVTTLLDAEALTTNPVHEFRRAVINSQTLEATPKTSYRSFSQYSPKLNANIITDVCGNKLDGDRDGTAEGSPVDDYSWSFITGNTLKCQPEITSITPTSGYYSEPTPGDELTIRGNYFRLAGDVIFNRDVYPSDFCFNTNNFPNQTCWVSWTNQEIKIKVPAAGGASQGASSGQVYTKVGNVLSNAKYFTLQSPYIQFFGPNHGGRGQAITLRGTNFGDVQNKVYFIPENDPNRVPKIEGIPICGESGWHDYEIIVAVPQWTAVGNYYLQVESQDGKFSNVRLDETFEVVDEIAGPTLCDIQGYCPGNNIRGGKPSDKKDLTGFIFGSARGQVIFNSTPAIIVDWQAEKINIEVPEIAAATYQVKVVTPTFKESNSLTFISPCVDCAIGDDGKVCKGGECCSNDCATFINQNDCSKQNGCSWNNLICEGSYEPYCCAGRCSDHKCLNLCGNGQIDEGEECDPGPPENLNNKTCELLGYEGGTLGCDGTCKFKISDCLGAGGHGNWGEKCINLEIKNNGVSYCTSGRDDCSLAIGARCVQNATMPPVPHCACCCQPEDQANGITDSCKITDCSSYLNKDNCNHNLKCLWDGSVCKNKLACSTEKACGDFGQKGLCCGCDVDAACGDYMVCSKDKCCYSLPAPSDLKFLASSSDQINLSWKFSDANNFGTHFEVYKKDFSDPNFVLLTTCEVGDANQNGTSYECDATRTELNSQTSGLYNFKDKRGNFVKDKDYIYKIRTKKGTTYSRETTPVTGQISGTSSCQINSDCSQLAPCCRTDSKVCVDWNNCQGHCQENGNCKAPSIKFAVHDFLVTTEEKGPCLTKIVPRSGKINASVVLTGLRFGASRGSSEVTFSAGEEERVNANYSVEPPLIWTDQSIDHALVPHGTADGDVKVVVNNRESNGISFDFIPDPAGPGDPCFYSGVCILETGYCSSPFSCLVNSNDCRCCCNPALRGSNDLCKQLPGGDRLECSANQGTCTGDNRGLCCGCQTDNDCGDPTKVGCGIAEPTPHCCHNRPTWEDISFCDATSSGAVKLNSGVTLNFSEKMDFRSLNKDNVKISREGNCLSSEEGQPKNNRCYLNGNVANYNDESNKTVSVFSPKLCQLQPGVTYQIEIVVDQSEGVRSEKGVSIYNVDGACSWDQTKKCQVQQFTTINDKNLCEIEWIDVQPRSRSLKEVNQTAQYQAIARDTKNQAVCVQEFEWSSSDENIAVVTTPGLETTATSKGIGQKVIIIAKITSSSPNIPNKTCLTLPNHTCGLLNISLEGPKVVEQKTCETCNLGGQSPSPSNFSSDACLASQIVARFDKEMRQSTLNSNTIKIVECGEDLGKCESPISVNGKIETWGKGFSFKALDINPEIPQPINLLSNKVYRVTLLSGPNGIKDTNGLELDGNKNTVQDGSPSDDYVWYFKTKNDATCPLSKICVDPPSDKVVIPDQPKATFYGRVYTTNCNYLEANDSTWQWSSLDQGIATVKPIGPGASTVATGLALGQTYIKALAEGQEDQASLIVATRPVVDQTYPSGSNLCLNTAIYAQFDQKMEQNSFINNFKIESEDAGGVGAPHKIDETSNFTLRFVTKNDQTFVYFVPQTFLKSKTKYYLNIYGSINILGKTGVESIAPYGAKMANSMIWNFTTGVDVCRLEKVQVEPSQYSFTRRNETKDFIAKALYKNTEIQGVPGSYDWSWSWQSTDSGVASVDPQQGVVTSQSKSGLISIIATAKIIEDKIFVPSTVNQEKKGAAKVDVWLCENPWPSINYPKLGESYQDESTQFSFRYCRDAGASGLDGDLPILKGGSLTNPPQEPGLKKLGEHFFTVYDGALSFFYDGSMLEVANPKVAINKSGYNNSERYNLFGDNNGIVTGSVNQVSGGKFGNGLSFDGKSYLSINYDGVKIGRNATIETDKFTLEAWVNTKENLPAQYIFKKGNPETTIKAGYGLDIRNDGKVYFWLFDKNQNKVEISTDFISSGGTIPEGWKHVAATYDDKNLNLYINGILSVQAPASGIKQSNSNLLIGSGFKGILDDVAFWQKALTKTEIEKHLKSSPAPTLGDVIGFKVFSNFEHLKSGEWYKKYAPGQKQSGSSKTIDGYLGYQVGRTVYVAATNVNLVGAIGGSIYTNLYLVSQNDKAQPGTNDLFDKVIVDWKLNINIPDPDETTPENENKLKLVRDLNRIYNLKDVWKTLETYKDINTKEKGFYPRLGEGGGTWVLGMSTSKWPSWTSQTGLGQDLVKAGLTVLPVDPVNIFSLRNDCSQVTTKYSCCADCPRDNPDCSQTCYNAQANKYEGVNSCNIYQYMVEGNPLGTAYGFYTTFEYSRADNWQHQCEELNQSGCQSNAFCYWEPAGISYSKNIFSMAQSQPINGTCKKKVLNYDSNLQTGNPCAKTGNGCACFNTRFYSASPSATTVTP